MKIFNKWNQTFSPHRMTSANGWDFFTSQAPSYKKTVIHWIMSARQELTQLSRLKTAISESEKQNRHWDKYKQKEEERTDDPAYS
jgi:hypothetical protein